MQLSATQKSESATLTHRNAELEEELSKYKSATEESEATAQALQQKLDQLEAANDSSSQRRDEDQNWSIIRDELHRQAAHMRALETTNTRLNAELGIYKDRHSNIEVLREEKHALERKVAIMEELRERVMSLEAQVDVARQERQEWLVSRFLQRRF